jgi:hypothetical protein
MHVGEDRRNVADVAGRFGPPGGRVKMFDQHLVHAIIGGKNLACGSAELSVNLVLTRGHGSLLLELSYPLRFSSQTRWRDRKPIRLQGLNGPARHLAFNRADETLK